MFRNVLINNFSRIQKQENYPEPIIHQSLFQINYFEQTQKNADKKGTAEAGAGVAVPEIVAARDVLKAPDVVVKKFYRNVYFILAVIANGKFAVIFRIQ